jgi:HK97 family phage major capsid protein
MRTLASMQTEKTELLARAGELVNRGLKNNSDKVEYNRLLAESDRLAEDIAMFQTIESGLRSNQAQQDKPAPVSAEVGAMLTPEQSNANRNQAYLDYFTRGHIPNRFEQRDLTTASDGSGAALIAQDWQPQWTAALKQFGPLASLVRLVVKTEGSQTKVPLADSTSQTMTYQATLALWIRWKLTPRSIV